MIASDSSPPPLMQNAETGKLEDDLDYTDSMLLYDSSMLTTTSYPLGRLPLYNPSRLL